MYDSTTITAPADDFNEAEFLTWLDNYETKPHSVRCKTCKTVDTAPQRELQLKGWLLVGKGEFCPSH